MSFIRYTAASLLLVAAPLAAGAQSVAVPEHIPSNVKAMVTVTDMNGLWAAWSATPLSASIDSLFQLPALQNEPDFQEAVLEMDKAELVLGYGLRPKDLFGETIRGLDLYVVRSDDQADPDFVLVSKFSEAERVGKLVDYLKSVEERASADRTAAGRPAMALTTTTVGGVEVTGNEELEVQFAGKGDVFLFSNSAAAMADAISSTGPDRLQAIGPLQAGYSKVSDRTGQVVFYLDGREALDVAARYAPRGAEFDKITTGATVGTLNLTPQGIDLAWFSGMENPTPAEKAVLDIAPTTMKGVLSFVDGMPLFAAGSNQLDGPLLMQLSQEAAGGDPSAMAQMQAFSEQIEAMTGLDFETEIVPAFGPDVILAVQDIDLSGGMLPKFDALAVLKVRDAAKATAVVQKFEEQLTAMMTQQMRQMNPSAPAVTATVTQYDGASLRSIPFTGGPMPIPMSLTHTITADGYWVLGLSDGGVKAALGRHTGNGHSLATVAASASTSGRIPTEFNTLSVVNFRQVASTVGQLVPLFGGMMGGGADMEAINKAVEIVANMGVGYAATASTPDGQTGYGRLLLQ